MKKFLPALLIVSLFAFGSCKKKADEWNAYMGKATPILTDAFKHYQKTQSWMRGFNAKNVDKYKAGIKDKIKEIEAIKAKVEGLKLPNSEMKAIKDLHVETVGLIAGLYKDYEAGINDPAKAKDIAKKDMEFSKKLNKAIKDEKALVRKYAKKHGLQVKN